MKKETKFKMRKETLKKLYDFYGNIKIIDLEKIISNGQLWLKVGE